MEANLKLIEIIDKDGKKLDGEILFSFEANGDNFVLYQLGKEVFAAKVDDKNRLSQVENDEWPLVEKIFEQFLDDQELEMENA